MEEPGAVFYAVLAVVYGEYFGGAVGGGAPERDAGVGAVFAEDVVDHVEVADFFHVAVVAADDAAEGFHAGFFGAEAAAHAIDDGVGTGYLDVFFAGTGGSGGADVGIGVTAGADDGRIAEASGNFECLAGGCCCAGDLAFGIDAGDVDGSGGGPEHLIDGEGALVLRDAEVDGHGGELLSSRADFIGPFGAGVARDYAVLLRIERGRGVGGLAAGREHGRPPEILAGAAFFPKEPYFAGVVGEHVFAFEAVHDSEVFGSLADEHDVAAALHDELGDEAGVADALQCADGACGACGAMHAAGVELDDAVFIGQAAVSDAVVVRVIFAGDADVVAGVECVGAVEEHLVGFFDGVVAGVARDDDGLLGRWDMLDTFGWLRLRGGECAEAGCCDCAA